MSGPESPRRRAKRTPRAPTSPLARVLVVEPDARALAAVADALEAGSLATVRVRDVAHALGHEALPSVSAVVSALEQPRTDGLELLMALRAEPATRHLPVVLLTRRPVDEVLSLATRFGADAVLAASTAGDVLCATIRRLAGLEPIETSSSGHQGR